MGGILMTGKEKFELAINGKEGPILFDIGGFPTSGIHCIQVEKLREYYGLEKKPVTVHEPGQMLGYVDQDLKDAMGIQTTPLWGAYTTFAFKNENFKEYKTPWEQTVLVGEKFVTTEDEEGSIYLYAEGDLNYSPTAKMAKSGFYFDNQVRTKDFDEDTYNVEDNLEEFKPIGQDSLDYLAKQVEKIKDTGDFVAGNFGGASIGDIYLVPGPSLKDPKGIRDLEEWYVSTVIRQDKLHQIFTYQIDMAIQNLGKIYEVVGETVQAIYLCGTDFGTQQGPFISNELFRDLYAPYYKKINNWIHENTGWKSLKHCCGSIRPLIPEFIDVGFDILNPIQWSAENMNRKDLKSEFGDKILFWGGGVDTQKTLPYGTSQEVYDEVKESCEIFSKNGGFVFNTIHNIQPLIPIENIVSMVNAVRDFNEGR